MQRYFCLGAASLAAMMAADAPPDPRAEEPAADPQPEDGPPQRDDPGPSGSGT